MRKKLYNRVRNNIERMGTDRLTLRSTYTTASNGKRSVDVMGCMPGRVLVIYTENKGAKPRGKARVYNNMKAINDIRRFLG